MKMACPDGASSNEGKGASDKTSEQKKIETYAIGQNFEIQNRSRVR